MSHESRTLIAIFIFVPFLLSAMWLFYMVHVYTERAEAFMKNSSFIQANKSLYFRMGLIGKAMRNGLLTLALLTPSVAAKRGLLVSDDVKSFPIGLKCILFCSWGSSCVFSVALVAVDFFS